MSTTTPMMAQYLDIKAQYQDALLFYRMGDFYELFFDDAVHASAALNIALTKRGKHDGAEIPMCGVPYHASETYLQALIKHGFRVAVAEQLETPTEAKKRGAKSVVKRDVVRLVTPGTLTEDALLDARQHNYLASFGRVRDKSALAWVDISTGQMWVMPCELESLSHEIAQVAPSELILSQSTEEEVAVALEGLSISLSPLTASSFDSASAKTRLTNAFNVATTDAFGEFSPVEMSALGALISYLEITQKGKLPLLQPPKKRHQSSVVQIDPSTRRNLEVLSGMNGQKDGSLLSCLDATQTASGARLLNERLSAPSCDLHAIQALLDTVSVFHGNETLRDSVRSNLAAVSDIGRSLSRLSLDRGGPRDMGAIRNSLKQAEHLFTILSEHDFPDFFTDELNALTGHSALTQHLDAALADEMPLLARDGGFIRDGFDEELDAYRKLRDDGRSVIAGLQADYAKICDVNALKIKHNNVLGYFIETTALHAEKMLSAPLSETFIHRQTTANAVRFTTVDLSELETKILNAGGSALGLENRHYTALKDLILESYAALTATARAFSEIDVCSAFAHQAIQNNWCKPKVDDTKAFDIKSGRHPVVEHALTKNGKGGFIANDCVLSKDNVASDIWLLTGPNMAGKSTFLRQNAIITLMAQAGSFVPASSAHIGIVSQLFSRVGASDDLAQGRSTFMVEMVETAAILNQADERALVILDEIGRGTATYDGLSIAWATLEHLHNVNKCRGLFATHYHEMTGLADQLSGVENATVTVKEWEGEIIFLHEVRKGAADRSYGVQVGQLAGLPKAVVHRAREVLERLEKGEREGGVKPTQLVEDLPLFSAKPAPVVEHKTRPSAVQERLEDVFPDDMTAKEALDLIYELKRLADV